MNYTDKVAKHTNEILAMLPPSKIEREGARTVALMTAAMSPSAYQRYLTEVSEKAPMDGKGFKAVHNFLREGASRILAEERSGRADEQADEIVFETATQPQAA